MLYKWIIAIAIVVFTVVVCLWTLNYTYPSFDDGSKKTVRLNYTISEDASIRRSGYYGIDFIKCGSCKVEKRKFGPLVIGGFNTLVLKDLSVVIPSDLDEILGVQKSTESSKSKDITDSLGMGDMLAQLRASGLRFSGLRIENFELNKLSATTNVVRILSAKSAKAKLDGLYLSGCIIYNNGVTNRVGEAVLKANEDLRLYWDGGELTI